MIEAWNKKNREERLVLLLMLGCILTYLAVFAFSNFAGFAESSNADMYEDTLVAKLMWEQKTLFPKGWTFGNQFYVTATPVAAAAFYGLTGNTNTAMALATEFMTAMIFLALFYLLRALTDDLTLRTCGALLLLASVVAYGKETTEEELFFIQASYYACYLITLLVVYGDYIRAFRSRSLRPVAWTLSLLLSFAAGMQSLRQTVVMTLPLLACECFQALRRLLQREKLWRREDLWHLGRCLSYAAANAAGIIAIKLLSPPQVTIYGGLELADPEQIGQKLKQILRCLTAVTGARYMFKSDYPLFFTVFALFVIGLSLAAGILWLARIRKEETPLELCWLLLLVGVLGVFASSLLFQVGLRSIYIFPWYPLLAISGIMVLKRLVPQARNILCLIICVLSLGNLYYTYNGYVKNALREDVSAEKQACRWIMDQGYEYVYGGWAFVAPLICVHSDGALTAGSWFKDVYVILDYINPLDIYDEEDNAKAVYVFRDDDIERGRELAEERGVTLTELKRIGQFRICTSPVQLMIPSAGS